MRPLAAIALLFTLPASAADRHPAEHALLPSPGGAASQPHGLPLGAAYDDGFRLRTADGATDLRFVWSAQLDVRHPMGHSVAPTSFDLRRARLDLIATVHKNLFMRVGLAAEDSPYIRNAFADYAAADFFHVRVGQMKVPFSTEWASFDNQVNFMERAHAQPLHPFLDRGILLWGKVLSGALTYNLGAFAGVGVDADAPRGDVDQGKEVAFRLFAQPFRDTTFRALRGLYLVSQGTWESSSAVTRRFETRGTITPTFDSNIWRWRADQLLGTDGRSTDAIGATVAEKARVGAELHYLLGPFTLSAEASILQWRGIELFHAWTEGSRTIRRDTIDRVSGSARALSVWTSVFVTGEQKLLDNFGWRQPNPKRPMIDGAGYGALELLARASVLDTDDALFRRRRVDAYRTADGEAGARVAASVLEGARRMYEITLGASWTLAYAVRLQVNFVHTWVPHFVASENGIVSGASSEMADAARRNTLVPSESMLGARFIFRI